MIKINYIIATWNGVRVKPVNNIKYYDNVLKNHIKTLNNITNSITQITIMKPKSGIVNSYYNIELKDNIKIIDCENKYQSYGQWLKATELFLNDFDYFIFIEDDYIPNVDNFDIKLIEIYEENTYLCSLADDTLFPYKNNCAISNGIISKETVKNILLKINFDVWLKEHQKDSFGGTNYQIPFSRYFFENKILLQDYRKYYMVDFYNGKKIIDYTLPNVLHKEKIFTPIQSVY